MVLFFIPLNYHEDGWSVSSVFDLRIFATNTIMPIESNAKHKDPSFGYFSKSHMWGSLFLAPPFVESELDMLCVFYSQYLQLFVLGLLIQVDVNILQNVFIPYIYIANITKTIQMDKQMPNTYNLPNKLRGCIIDSIVKRERERVRINALLFTSSVQVWFKCSTIVNSISKTSNFYHFPHFACFDCILELNSDVLFILGYNFGSFWKIVLQWK